MTPAARIAAAIEIFAQIDSERRPAADVLTEWGRTHRFAGSGDRAAIASLTYDALRKRASSAWVMDDATARGVLLGSLREAGGLSVEAIAALCTGEGHAPSPLTDAESERLATATLDGAPSHVAGDFPEWMEPHLRAAFGDALGSELGAFAQRATLDLRVNILKTSREKALAALDHLGATATPFAPDGLRIAAGKNGRAPALTAERAYLKGWVEVQDEGSQLAALLAGAQPGEQVLDLCAGAGGKSLALAAQMGGKGQVYAFDADGRRLAPIFARLERADARNVQVRTPKGATDVLCDLRGRCDLVLVDAPCSGTGTWRRNPDAKWRIRPGAIEQRVRQQDELLMQAGAFVKPGGRLAYITCSILREENEERIDAFVAAHPEFVSQDAHALLMAARLPDVPTAAATGPGVRLTPARTGTDGFYICVMQRRAGPAARPSGR